MVPTITRNFPEKTRESAERCFALMREGKLKLHIGKTFPLARAADAHRLLESRQSSAYVLLANTATREPGRGFVTPSLTASITPAASSPGVSGSLGCTAYVPWRKRVSAKFTPIA